MAEAAGQVAAPKPKDLKPKHSPWQAMHDRWKKLSKTQRNVILIVIGVLFLGGVGTGVWAATRPKPLPPPPPVAKVVPKPTPTTPTPKPTTVASVTTGLQVDPSVNQRPVTGVMIENSPDARPQSGLDHADVVFEAVAEGGITRFLAIFHDSTPDYIGPVRSVRPYYLQWCLGFDCAIAHVGGSPEALTDIPAWHVKNLDEFAHASSFHRIDSRVAPHNVYTSLSNLNQLESNIGYGAASFTSWARKAEEPPKKPSAAFIDLAISSPLYNDHFQYDEGNNDYVRNEGGEVHYQVDGNGTPSQITPKVLIALVMSQGIEADDQHTAYGTIGTGAAYIFQDGQETTGTWVKSDIASQITFRDSNNQQIPLDAGQTWVTILGASNELSYHP